MENDKGKEKKKGKTLVAITVGKHREKKKKGKKTVGISQLGREEREMMLSITGPQPLLDYPLHVLQLSDGTFTQEYEIPEEEREAVFRKLYLFDKPPAMDETILDIHEDKKFKVRDFRVIREGEGNFIVSPYYPVSGGTLLDWVNCSEIKQEPDVIIVAKVFHPHSEKD